MRLYSEHFFSPLPPLLLLLLRCCAVALIAA
jgi:hypothetical protein